MKILSFKAAVLAACVLLVTGAANAATLSTRPSSTIYEGTMLYGFDLFSGVGSAIGDTSGTPSLMFEISGVFYPGSPAAFPTGVNLLLSDPADPTPVLSAIDLEEFEVGAGFVALLLGDLTGPAASSFNGGKVLAILRDPSFPALSGAGTFELRSLNPTTVIPLPAAAPLMLAGLGALVCVARRRAA